MTVEKIEQGKKLIQSACELEKQLSAWQEAVAFIHVRILTEKIHPADTGFGHMDFEEIKAIAMQRINEDLMRVRAEFEDL